MAFANDSYDFDKDDYIPSQVTDFESSFMEQFCSSDEEEEFIGFTREDIFLAGASRVCSFHVNPRAANPAEKDKDNVDPETRRTKKRKADPTK